MNLLWYPIIVNFTRTSSARCLLPPPSRPPPPPFPQLQHSRNQLWQNLRGFSGDAGVIRAVREIRKGRGVDSYQGRPGGVHSRRFRQIRSRVHGKRRPNHHHGAER